MVGCPPLVRRSQVDDFCTSGVSAVGTDLTVRSNMVGLEIAHLTGIALTVGACLALAAQNLLIRKGTDTGRAYDAVLMVMAVNMVVLLPIVGIYYYPDYGITLQSVLSFTAAGLFGTMFGRAFKYVSIGRIGASRTEPIINTNAFVATILGVALLGERLGSVHLLAIVAIVAGVGVISWETTQENPHDLSRRELLLGMVLPFGGAVAYGIEPIFATYGLNAGMPAPVGVVVKTIAATVGFVAYLRFDGTLPTLRGLGASNMTFFALAGLGNTAFLLGYYVALGLAPVSVVVPILPTSTLFTVGLSAVFMPDRLERITSRLAVAALVVVAGVIALTLAG